MSPKSGQISSFKPHSTAWLSFQRRPLSLLAILGGMVWLSSCGEIPALIGNEALLVDSFTPGETANWLLENDGLGENRLEDGRLFIKIEQPYTVQYATLRSPEYINYAAEVEVTQVSGSLNSSYGMLFRLTEEEGFYRFAITGDGFYIFEKYVVSTGQWERYPGGDGADGDWVESPAILQGLGQVNRLKVTVTDSRFAIAINGFEVGRYQDVDFVRGALALSAGTFSQPDLEVAFDNLILTRP